MAGTVFIIAFHLLQGWTGCTVCSTLVLCASASCSSDRVAYATPLCHELRHLTLLGAAHVYNNTAPKHLACKASKQRHPTPACKAGHAHVHKAPTSAASHHGTATPACTHSDQQLLLIDIALAQALKVGFRV
jgi:hypothetical protein